MALAVVAILAVVIIDFSFSVRVDLHIAANFRDRLVALEAAKAGVHYAIYTLRQDEPREDNLRDEWAQLGSMLEPGIVLDKTDPAELAEEERLAEEDLKLYKHEDFLACQKGGNIPTTKIVIVDEERKINMNFLAGPGANPIYRQCIESLIEHLEFPDVDPYELVENITDWIDTDDDGDAEYLYYEDLPQPYSCRNGPMESIYELKLVKGMNDLLFFGNTPYPVQLSGLEEDQWEEGLKLGYTLPELPPWEREQDPDAIYGLVNFLTAHSSGKVNLNTAPPEVLLAVLGGDEFLANMILEAREENPLQSKEITDLIRNTSPALYSMVSGLIAFRSSYFRIEATGEFHKAAVKVTAIVFRDGNRETAIHYWRVEDVRPESVSEDIALANGI